ncbi:HyaD/HybD family hydrogenase maturation endopeptidase [bacterium endosymbiont of Bathymodiolus sp. 5 South]|jgi:hydrogenase maturation protease|uniref:HyaD/HybD family hydrogenase maturation endopeptidase n=1 Tax=bacterium endosymbiont of Bathymodiolus sp. 5 South TaxID=1181670 RepID=UPI000255FD56|nr:HyaD/HybD family hydrogenase maturation endopeptidase [bacterium endosymbiont of Bathymodiolus sp. 5 South]CAC9437383.1 Hydrogenase 1 maturation protease HyaD [uncultured Gammaproteobacteria bacterium]CAC9441137.1 Hydrogenase 1 maturation protease HyaD [uncultured Gammaproteobacteria bacterium]SHN91504.1 Hydrogenase 1 maturation protease HyaD [bacterium endosymbiont of Bathymodiolus sp. 5 South]VVH56260.1 Hydrogenase 1 maturation protease HyaD [uncultured Gammaproteobacteria bacterium]VVH63
MRVLILGVGNILWADEGFGVRTVEAINQQYEFDEDVVLMDGGTQGLYLIQHVQACDLLIVFDAIDYGLEPGTMKLIHDADVPKFMGAKKMSLHQTGFQEVLSTAELTGETPEHIFLIGVQPVELEDFGGSLRDKVKAQIQPAIEECLKYLDGYGIEYQKRTTPLEQYDGVNSPTIGLVDYEVNRPSEELACRKGDGRVLFDNSFEQRQSELVDTDCNTNIFVDGRKHFEGQQ